MHETTLSLPYSSVEKARLVQAALAPEAGDIAGDRTTVSIERKASELAIHLEASDPVALRAGQNTWLGFVEVAERVETTAEADP